MKANSNVYIISDNHFRHWNINRYCNRGFENIYKMETHMIAKWNSIVPKTGKVIVLGDIAMTQGKSKEVSMILARLNGKKLLVMGNHDRKNHFWYMENGIDFVCDSFLWYWNKKKILFIHNPSKVKHEDFGKYDYIIHGHKHNNSPLISKEYNVILVNVSVENLQYTPKNLLLLLQKLQNKKYLKKHHNIDF